MGELLAIVVVVPERVLGHAQVFLEARLTGLDEGLPDLDGGTVLAQQKVALGLAVQEFDVLRLGTGQFRVEREGLARGRVRRGLLTELVGDLAHPQVSRGQTRSNRRVVPVLLEEVLVETAGRDEQLAPQRLHTRHLEELTLAHLRQVIVDGRAGHREVGDGALPLGLGVGEHLFGLDAEPRLALASPLRRHAGCALAGRRHGLPPGQRVKMPRPP